MFDKNVYDGRGSATISVDAFSRSRFHNARRTRFSHDEFRSLFPARHICLRHIHVRSELLQRRTTVYTVLFRVGWQVTAWCSVPSAGIDLPVCQATDEDPSFWLAHDLWGSEPAAGTPYLDHRTNADATHVLCYGHHLMGVGGMFSVLQRCHEQEAFDRTLADGLLWSTPGSGTVRMRPLCASVVDMDDASVQRFDFEGTRAFRSWLDGQLRRSSAKATDATDTARGASRAVTLVTCSSDLAGQRERTVVTFVE